jgi:hypothetical protein
MTSNYNILLRFCSRCGQPLTDPASVECGVGPICRGKDNHLYAKTIPANLPLASAIVLGTDPSQFPTELADEWSKVRDQFIALMARTEQQTALLFTGADFRQIVRKIDWFLSWRMGTTLRNRLVKVVHGLGYIGLAGVLSGEASTSEAKVWFENGRVYLSGKANRHGFSAMRRIPGITYPRRRGDRTPYSAPADQATPFLDAVAAFWPMYEGNLIQVRETASAWTEANRAPATVTLRPTSVPRTRPVNGALITRHATHFTLKFDWVAGAKMYEMVNALKTIPYADRKYNPASKEWTFRLVHLDRVKEILGLVFDKSKIVLNG